MNWDKFVGDVEQIGEAVGCFLENHWKTLLVLLAVLMFGVVWGYSTAHLEYTAAEQAEAYAETIVREGET